VVRLVGYVAETSVIRGDSKEILVSFSCTPFANVVHVASRLSCGCWWALRWHVMLIVPLGSVR